MNGNVMFFIVQHLVIFGLSVFESCLVLCVNLCDFLAGISMVSHKKLHCAYWAAAASLFCL